MNESVLDIDFSHADVMDYYIFACVILKLHQNFDAARSLLDQAEQTVSALKDDTSIVSPGFSQSYGDAALTSLASSSTLHGSTSNVLPVMSCISPFVMRKSPKK